MIDFLITSLKTNNHTDKLWRVIWSLKPDGHKITSFDIIKVGWMKFKVWEFRSSTQYFNIEEHGDLEEFEETKEVCDVPEKDLNEMCWFCWVNEYTEENPKIGTCNCIGTVKYIHYECLKAWLHTKMTNKNSDNAFTLSWKHFECELCKMHYPY